MMEKTAAAASEALQLVGAELAAVVGDGGGRR